MLLNFEFRGDVDVQGKSVGTVQRVLLELRDSVRRAESSLEQTKNYFSSIGVTFEDLDRLISSDSVSDLDRENLHEYEQRIEREIEEEIGLQKQMFPDLHRRGKRSRRKRINI